MSGTDLTVREDAPEGIGVIQSYHAHLYFGTPDEKLRALRVRDWIAAHFPVQLGRVHDRPVGPHAVPMYQVAFGTEVFHQLTPWLMLNRLGLSVLIHPNTGRARDDHLIHALCLGPPLPLLADTLPNSLSTGGGVSAVEVNTRPSRTSP